ncbi:MAG: hypothetical protein WC295_02290 [Methanoregula sp.]|jgi:multisubunit Na+/H+ antiporter MnhC subunit
MITHTTRRNLLIGGVFIAIGVVLLLLRDWMPPPVMLLSVILIAVGLLFVAISTFQIPGAGGTSAVLDERVLKIRAHTFSKAFSFSFTVVCILGILDFSGLLTLPSRTVIEIIFLTMGLSAFFLSWHYNRRGNIDAG